MKRTRKFQRRRRPEARKCPTPLVFTNLAGTFEFSDGRLPRRLTEEEANSHYRIVSTSEVPQLRLAEERGVQTLAYPDGVLISVFGFVRQTPRQLYEAYLAGRAVIEMDVA